MEKEWYYLKTDNNQEGPVNFDEICSRLEKKEILSDTMVRKISEANWLPVKEHPEISFIAEKMRTPDIINNQEIDQKYKKVGGWLLLFCIGIGILTPIINFYNLYQILEMFFTYDLESNEKVYLFTDAVILISFIVLSFITGYKLFRIVPGAVTFAKAFLFIVFITNLLQIILPYAFLEDEIAAQLSREGMRDTFKSFVYGIIWGTYLTYSKRVDYTYSLGKHYQRKKLT